MHKHHSIPSQSVSVSDSDEIAESASQLPFASDRTVDSIPESSDNPGPVNGTSISVKDEEPTTSGKFSRRVQVMLCASEGMIACLLTV